MPSLSIFTTQTRPAERGDNYKDALACFKDLADELVIIDGEYKDTYWPKEFDWPLIGEQFQKGYDKCSSDWVLFADLDYIFHERDFVRIRKVIEVYNDFPALSFYKYQFILPDRYNLKSRKVILANKGRFGDRIRFNGGGDLCQITIDNEYLTPDDVPASQIAFYNYEKIIKTKSQIADDVGRMERAYSRHFGVTQYGSDGTDEDAYNKWVEAQVGKFNKPQQKISLSDHPKYVQETILNLKPENWGYNGHGNLEVNGYVKSN